ncbi:MAG: hypothetical protein JW744_02525 [Candidatus Diapherotrites archaeon]|uniref:Uncharacterized protein n=1 Tax=Candidatus Iainarchaeum sp. TaxID=3101447 RepID=A0A938YXU3_9ARCH|nr:hypothetical protein [Candidatus Diapherotrites archaeon]
MNFIKPFLLLILPLALAGCVSQLEEPAGPVVEDFEDVSDWKVIDTNGGTINLESETSFDGNALNIALNGVRNRKKVILDKGFHKNNIEVNVMEDRVLGVFDVILLDENRQFIAFFHNPSSMPILHYSDAEALQTFRAEFEINKWYKLRIEKADQNHFNVYWMDENRNVIEQYLNRQTMNEWTEEITVRLWLDDQGSGPTNVYYDEMVLWN